MIFRTEFPSAGVAGAVPAKIVKALIAACPRLSGSKWRRSAHVLTLSNHQMRDIGLHRPSRNQPGAFDLLDLVPRGAYFAHREPR